MTEIILGILCIVYGIDLTIRSWEKEDEDKLSVEEIIKYPYITLSGTRFKEWVLNTANLERGREVLRFLKLAYILGYTYDECKEEWVKVKRQYKKRKLTKKRK